MTSEERAHIISRENQRWCRQMSGLFCKANISHEVTICVCCQSLSTRGSNHMCLLSTRGRKMTLGRFRGSAIWKCELSIEKSFVRELTECYMLRPLHTLLHIACCLLAPCKRRIKHCWELLRLFERSLRFLSPQSSNFSNPQSLQYSITSEPPIEDVLHVFHQCSLLNVLKETISAKSK